ncbi:SMP-30/gluconolactonase/LRE family protein [Rhizobium sp. G187]|uniref:SMP-30/gluconolactonase/LRE family protein n=1 Tax=Rhizobium sp. G187 TaxID=3451352 RepID=UPI003EE5CD55
MVATETFKGTVLSKECLELGEGPSYDPITGRLWWFDILGSTLCELDVESGQTYTHALPFKGSVIASVDDQRQMLASDKGLYLRDRQSGVLTPYVQIEDKPSNRSNDGRVHPSGALWIGTMSRTAETGAGAIFHIAGTQVTKLFEAVSIPNGICFSPDGTIGYFNDSKVNHMMSVELDPLTGLPRSAPKVLIDQSARKGVIDGSVTDLEGTIWNSNWDGGAVDRYAPDGRHLSRHAVPVSRPTCPAFFGKALDRLAVTSCWEGLTDEERGHEPLAGALFDLGVSVRGKPEPLFKL